ncbi:hypothetical protein F4821DRAFT_208442 [Hypoxylon rubiginosum]|uniref:Uncharacterized protein n=1 Tax=Hypoxylon rubiginosum TaxID=110542 RepID=A0ACC0CQH5_9PEZI|nr:hypothetical protein F4821DRAFT_208442 [Hypoxylon rubiginosum]
MPAQKLNGSSLSRVQRETQPQSDSSDNEVRITPLSLTSFFRRNSTKAQVPQRQRSASNAPQPVQRSNTYHASQSTASGSGRGRGHTISHNDKPPVSHSQSQRKPANIPRGDSEASGTANLKRHGAITRPVQGRGTRGIFVPVYSSPINFTQAERLRNPGVHLPVIVSGQPDRPVAVRFYHCESLYLAKDPLSSPTVDALVSAAVGFLGECELRGWAACGRHNAGYVGLNAIHRSDGFHMHYPDDAGVTMFEDQDICGDWEQILRLHRRYSPQGVALLVGVGLSHAGRSCVAGG